MTKKHFIALADVRRQTRPVDSEIVKRHATDMDYEHHIGRVYEWKMIRDGLADFCASQNGNFKRERWLAYIACECGPNGGKLK